MRKVVFFTILSLSCFYNYSFGQSQKKTFPKANITCEHIKNVLDNSVVEYNSISDGFFILIFTAGKNDLSGKKNKERLLNTKKYLEVTRGVNPQILKTAISNESEKLGKLEIFINGKLYEKLFFNGKESLVDICKRNL